MINPLPSFGKTDEPLAKGLFDFDDEGEEDLLHFKQVNSCSYCYCSYMFFSSYT